MSDPDVPINEESNDSFPGGPEDPSVLTTFKSHIAASIWMKKYRPPLKCLNHVCKVAEWHFDEQKGNLRFRNIIMHLGLSILSKCFYRYINRTLISAFVERWHPETNTFHLPFGEMTITLHDVFMITGIPITGRLVSLPTLDYEDVESLVVSALGVSREEAYEELSLVRGQSVRLEWLKERFSNINHSSDERAYLLYLLGGTLFSDKSGGRVSVVYLNLLMDLDRVHEYAWGSATLAYLYRQLGCATRSGVKQISGFLTLLEAWIYEHIPAYRPNRNLAYIDNLPRVSRWIPRRETGAKLEYLKATREALDMLHVNRVIWDPYGVDFPEITFYSGCLKCMDIVEPHHPERVLRQYKFVQTIPPSPYSLSQLKRTNTTSNCRILHKSDLSQLWDRWDSHVLSISARGCPVSDASDCSDNYSEWFHRISHVTIENPQHRSPFNPSNEESYEQCHSCVDLNQRISRALCIVDDTLDKGSDQFELDSLYDIITDIGSALRSQTSNIMKTCKLRRSVNLEKTPTSADGVEASCRKYSRKKKRK